MFRGKAHEALGVRRIFPRVTFRLYAAMPKDETQRRRPCALQGMGFL